MVTGTYKKVQRANKKHVDKTLKFGENFTVRLILLLGGGWGNMTIRLKKWI